MQNHIPLHLPEPHGLSLREVSCLFIGAGIAVLGYATIALFLDLAAQV